MFGRFFDTSAVNSLASWVAAELKKSLPADRLEYGSAPAKKKLEQLEARIRSHLASQTISLHLNVYQKAKLGLRLQEELESAGYLVTFYKPFAYDVVKLVAFASSQKL